VTFHAGGGLKFKVAQAMMCALPVVLTVVGADDYETAQQPARSLR
jgi:hypothetical protein